MKRRKTIARGRFRGFTYVELLIVVAILGILVAVAGIYATQYRTHARDVQRIRSMQSLREALAIYYSQYGHYPPAKPTATHGFNYRKTDCSTGFSDAGGYGLRYENGSSSGGIEFGSLVVPWGDPLGDGTGTSIFNCRYIIPMTSLKCGSGGSSSNQYDQRSAVGCNTTDAFEPSQKIWWEENFPQHADGPCHWSDCPSPYTYKEIQSYYLHCVLEDPGDEALNDGGIGPFQKYFYELFEPEPWVCMKGVPNKDGSIDNAPPPWYHE